VHHGCTPWASREKEDIHFIQEFGLETISSVLEIMDSAMIAVLVAVAVVVVVYMYFKAKGSGVQSDKILSSAVDATKPLTSKGSLTPSYDQNKGLTFSYTCWILVDDFAYRIGEQKVVFTKGPTDLSSMCPGVFLDGNTNSLLVKIDTFGAQEVIPISNIPAKKWLHFALVVDQDSVDVYINGILHTHSTLAQLPRQNPSPVNVGVGGGFQGKVADLNYYNYFLTPQQVAGSMGSPPSANPDHIQEPPTPPYFDITWWTGRTN
jgi:hypothetical protein